MSLPEEQPSSHQKPIPSAQDTTQTMTEETSASVSSIAPAGVLEKMFKVPGVKQVREKLKPATSELVVKVPQTMELSDIARAETTPDYKEPTEAFIVRHLKPGTDKEGLTESFFYHDVASIELDLYKRYLKDELSLEDMEAIKNHIAAVNIHILRTEIVTAEQGEVLEQSAHRLIKELEVGNIDPFMAESLLDLVNERRRKLAGFSRRMFMQEYDIRKMCQEAFAKTQKYIPATSDHWTIAKAFECLDSGQTDLALQILTLTREITWSEETSDLFWRKLRLSTFRLHPEPTLEQVTLNNKLLEQITAEMQKPQDLTEEQIKAKWEDLTRNEAIETLHEDLWCMGVAEGMRITTGSTHNDIAEKSGLPVTYDYSRFDPVTMWFLVGLHKKDSGEFHKYVMDSEKSGFNFWLSYVKSATTQGTADISRSSAKVA